MALLQLQESVQPHNADTPSKRKALGIDLGTTHSLVAFADHGRVTVIPDTQGRYLLPSAVYYGDTETQVGYDALLRLNNDPRNTIISFKRLMGKGTEHAQAARIHYAFSDTPGALHLQTRQGPISPIAMSAEILRTLKKRAAAYLQEEIEHAVISIPAYFNETQRQATKKAAEFAGLKVLRLLTEPTAAAIAYKRQQEEEKIAVYDLGGGTFDISILQLRKGIFQVLAIGGDTQLGGDDMDEALVDYWCSVHPQLSQYLSATDRICLKKYARDIKEQLTHCDHIPYDLSLPQGNCRASGRLTRQTFNHIIQPLIDKTLMHLDQALQAAHLDTEEIEALIIVGGATRVPYVIETLQRRFPGKTHHHLDPDQAVVIGAAHQADLLIGNRRNTAGEHPANAWLLLDVLPLSLGIETYGGIVEPIIARNTPIPAMRTQSFTTFKDGQTGIRIHVVQGERDMVSDCHSLAQFELSGIPPMKAGLAKVDISFQIDADGLLSVTAHEKMTNAHAEIMTMPSYGLTPEDIQKILRDSYEHAEEDMRRRQLESERVAAQQLIDHLTTALEEDSDLLTAEVKIQLEQTIQQLSMTIKTGDYDSLHSELSALNNASRDFSIARMNRALAQTLVGQRITPTTEE